MVQITNPPSLNLWLRLQN